jgi:glycerol-3-phosphate acyltransferase PlsY
MEPAATPLFLFPLVGYLAGSVPFGLLLVRLAGKGDVRSVGSGNIGATNAARAGGRGLGVLTLALDAAKGFLPVFLAGRWFGTWPGGGAPSPLHGAAFASLVALAAILGHVFTPWLRFRGGKGVATTLGAALALGPWAPWAVLPPLGVFLTIVAITRYVSLGSVLAAFAMPLSLLSGLLWRSAEKPFMLLAPWLAIASLVIFKHGPNMARLLKGTESPLWGAKRTKDQGDKETRGTDADE